MLFRRGSNFQLHIPQKGNIRVIMVPIFKFSNELHCEIKTKQKTKNPTQTKPNQNHQHQNNKYQSQNISKESLH